MTALPLYVSLACSDGPGRGGAQQPRIGVESLARTGTPGGRFPRKPPRGYGDPRLQSPGGRRAGTEIRASLPMGDRSGLGRRVASH